MLPKQLGCHATPRIETACALASVPSSSILTGRFFPSRASARKSGAISDGADAIKEPICVLLGLHGTIEKRARGSNCEDRVL